MLTQKQKDLLLFIHERMQDSGVPPSFDEMKVALDLKSKSGIHRLITALVERGFIRRLPHRARAIEVIKLPEGSDQGLRSRSRTEPVGKGAGDDGAVRQSNQPETTGGRGSLPSSMPSAAMIASLGVSVPVMGRIAAGVPIDAIENHTHDIACPPEMLAKGEHFALEVSGDSMIDAGIHDGDTVIIRRCNSANNGDIVVALVDKEEATLKRLRKRGSTVELEAANPNFETRVFGPDQVDVQGRLVGLVRRYD